MATINLLPQGATLKGKDKIFVAWVGKFVLIGFVVFIVSVLVVTGYLIYTSLRIKASISNEETLKAEIASLSQTEQSFYLIKDRISKIKTVLAKESLNTQIANLTSLVQGLSGEARILEVQISTQKFSVSLIFPTSQSFGTFYKSLIDSKNYKNIILKSFSFNPSVGYIATLELKNE